MENNKTLKRVASLFALMLGIAAFIFCLRVTVHKETVCFLVLALLPTLAMIVIYTIEMCRYNNHEELDSILLRIAGYLALLGVAAVMFTSDNTSGGLISLVAALVVILTWEWEDHFIAALVLTIFAAFGIVAVHTLYPETDAAATFKRYETYENKVSRSPWLTDDEKTKLLNSPYCLDDMVSAKKSICAEGESVLREWEKIIKPAFDVEVPKPKELYVKRCWLNSDEIPYSYHAWGTFDFSLTLRSGIFASEAKAKANVNYDANYVGNDIIQYVNIVLSDNTYYRINLEDRSEWLLVKEGDKVIKEYYKNDFDAQDLLSNSLCENIKLLF